MNEVTQTKTRDQLISALAEGPPSVARNVDAVTEAMSQLTTAHLTMFEGLAEAVHLHTGVPYGDIAEAIKRAQASSPPIFSGLLTDYVVNRVVNCLLLRHLNAEADKQ